MNVGYVHTFEVPENNIDKGRLKVSVVNEENVPIKGAAVRLSYTGNPDNIIGESGTDGDGISIFNDLRTPPIEYSMEPGNRQPFSEYDIAVSAPGFDNVNISGSDMFSGELSIQNVKMSARDNSQNNIVIPVNTLYGDYPPKIDEEEIKPMGQSGEIVLDRVVVPEIVVVHDGPPKDTEADNYYVTYKDYIKNVASSEIYSTWPRQTIEANVLAIMSFTLNRVYTEWYRNKFYDFTITSSTAYDQKGKEELVIQGKVEIIMKIKRIVSVAATFVMALGLFTGCGAASTDTTTTTANNNTTAVQDTVKSTAASDSTTAQTTPSSGKKTLIVYYSASGSTKAVAQNIAESADADIFEITPVNPYTSDDLNWTNNNSRVSKEHNDESLRNVELTKVTPDNWDSYDTVLIGYPIWWGIAAWPVDTFVKGNDFTGKTVIPFCTSTSSGLGDSGTRLQKLAGTGNWQAGQRFSSGASASEVSKWVKSLKLGN